MFEDSKKSKVILLIILLVVIITLFFYSKPKNCFEDYACFSSSAVNCLKASVITTNVEGHTFQYLISGTRLDSCIIDVTLLKTSDDSSYDLKSVLEGKNMRCAIPKEKLIEISIREMKDLNDFCTGQLKEAFLQITLNELYDLVVKNFGGEALNQS